jgi:lysozyme family protein
LTLARALEIYFQDYWLPIKGESLPPLLNLALFDSAVLCGSRKAVQWLQLSINEWWQGWEMEEPGVDFGVSHNKLAVDGVVGPRTLAAVNEVMAARDYDDRAYDYGHRYLINRIIWRRQIHHAKRVKLHPDQANWIHGWTKRCADLAKATWGKN